MSRNSLPSRRCACLLFFLGQCCGLQELTFCIFDALQPTTNEYSPPSILVKGISLDCPKGALRQYLAVVSIAVFHVRVYKYNGAAG